MNPHQSILSGFLILTMALQGWNFFLNMSDPFSYEGTVMATPVVKRGEDSIQLVNVHRYRLCDVKISRFMIHREPDAHSPLNGTVMLRVGNETGGASEIGQSIVPIHLKVPADALLGKACLIQRSASQCIDGMHITPWPEVCFEVVE